MLVLPFEKPVVDLVTRVKELRDLAQSDRGFEPELRRLEETAGRLAREPTTSPSPRQSSLAVKRAVAVVSNVGDTPTIRAANGRLDAQFRP